MVITSYNIFIISCYPVDQLNQFKLNNDKV